VWNREPCPSWTTQTLLPAGSNKRALVRNPGYLGKTGLEKSGLPSLILLHFYVVYGLQKEQPQGAVDWN